MGETQVVGGKSNLQISTGWPSEVCPEELDLTTSGEAGVMTSLYPAPSAVPAKLQGERLSAIFGDGFPQTLSLLRGNGQEIVLSNILDGPVSRITIRPISSSFVPVMTPFKESSYMLFEQTNTMRNKVTVSASIFTTRADFDTVSRISLFLFPNQQQDVKVTLGCAVVLEDTLASAIFMKYNIFDIEDSPLDTTAVYAKCPTLEDTSSFKEIVELLQSSQTTGFSMITEVTPPHH